MTSLDYAPWTADDPLVTVTITNPDWLSVRLFGIPFTLPAELEPVTRNKFGQVMDQLYKHLQQPFTVEVIETDGTRQTGTIDLRATHLLPPNLIPVPTPPVAPDAETMTRRLMPPTSTSQEPGGVTPNGQPITSIAVAETVQPGGMGGFTPGEPVALCLLVGLNTASPTGDVLAEVPSWLAGDVLLVGRTSGVTRLIPRKLEA
jgi:hypothetical protein